jgi:Integrase zinc binding domain
VGAGGTLICHKDKIAVMASLQRYVAEWYHITLCHLGVTRTKEPFKQIFWWNTLRENVQILHCHYDNCQRSQVNMAYFLKTKQKLNLGTNCVWIDW